MTATATGVLRHHCWSSLVMLFLNVNWERLQSRQNPKKTYNRSKKKTRNITAKKSLHLNGCCIGFPKNVSLDLPVLAPGLTWKCARELRFVPMSSPLFSQAISSNGLCQEDLVEYDGISFWQHSFLVSTNERSITIYNIQYTYYIYYIQIIIKLKQLSYDYVCKTDSISTIHGCTVYIYNLHIMMISIIEVKVSWNFLHSNLKMPCALGQHCNSSHFFSLKKSPLNLRPNWPPRIPPRSVKSIASWSSCRTAPR